MDQEERQRPAIAAIQAHTDDEEILHQWRCLQQRGFVQQATVLIERVAEEVRSPVSREPTEEQPETKLPPDKDSLLMEDSLEIPVPSDTVGSKPVQPYVPEWAKAFDPDELERQPWYKPATPEMRKAITDSPQMAALRQSPVYRAATREDKDLIEKVLLFFGQALALGNSDSEKSY